MNKGKTSTYLGYTWTILCNIFILFIVFAIFDSIYETFEIIMVSISIFIYLNLNAFTGLWAQQKAMEYHNFTLEFIKIRILLEANMDKIDKDDLEYQMKDEKKILQKKLETQKVKFNINMGFALLIQIYSLFNLLNVI